MEDKHTKEAPRHQAGLSRAVAAWRLTDDLHLMFSGLKNIILDRVAHLKLKVQSREENLKLLMEISKKYPGRSVSVFSLLSSGLNRLRDQKKKKV